MGDSAGKTWQRRAAAGRSGKFSRAVCVEEMIDPSGRVTTIGDIAGVTLRDRAYPREK